MTFAVIVLLGIAVLATGVVLLASFGSGYRVGRLIATTPRISVGEARDIAIAGRHAYVRVDGRIDSEAAFEDSAHRPLVLRRTRVQVRRGRRWTTVEDERELVPFEVQEGLDAIEIDGAALDEGLVVIPRLSAGSAADLGDRLSDTAPATAPARIRIDQVSAVEHATALGVPVTADGETVRLTSGLGRPLVLSTLETDETMRILAEGRRWRALAVTGLLALGAVLIVAGVALGLGQVLVGTARG